MRLRRNKGRAGAGGPGAAAERLSTFLRARGLRMTGERGALLRAALGRRRHFTLEDLVKEAVRADGRASRATVYRGLPILVEAGILHPVLVSEEPRRFELALGRRHHDHLLCRRCGRVAEFRSEAIEDLQLKVAARHGFRLTGHLHELLGDCAACRRAGRARAGEGKHPAPARVRRHRPATRLQGRE